MFDALGTGTLYRKRVRLLERELGEKIKITTAGQYDPSLNGKNSLAAEKMPQKNINTLWAKSCAPTLPSCRAARVSRSDHYLKAGDV